MRIISGIYKGRHIVAPSSFTLRPTTDMAKESLFNILNNEVDIEESSVLDLFAGIGSITYEFASRGSKDLVCVERVPKHLEFIKRTSKELQIEGLHCVLHDVRDFLKIAHRSFDIIFADPPYDLPWIDQIPDYIFASQVIHSDTIVIIEHPAEVSYTDNENYSHTRNYGKVHFSWFYPKE